MAAGIAARAAVTTLSLIVGAVAGMVAVTAVTVWWLSKNT